MIIDRNIAVPTRDGCRLATDLYRPQGTATVPVLLERTPYGRDRCDQAEQSAGDAVPRPRHDVATAYVAMGFAYAVQDCRGTGGSTGHFTKYLQEPDDGADAIEWLVRQPWCDGRAAMVGFSYAAMCQIGALAATDNGLVAAIADCGGFANAWRSGIRQGGAFDLKQATWSHAQALRDAKAAGDQSANDALLAEDVGSWLRRGPWCPGRSPLTAAPEQEASLAKIWHADRDDPIWYHPSLSAETAVENLKDLSILHISGWFDTSLQNTVDNFGRHAASETVRQVGLVIGPWTHGNRHQTFAGDLDFGDRALPEIGLGADIPSLRNAWLTRAFDPARTPLRPLRVFAMGGGLADRDSSARIRYGGTWLAPMGWPDIASEQVRFYLGDDDLQPSWSANSGHRTFEHDPENPVPTVGGAINSGEPIMKGGAFDQRTREGVLGVIPPFGPLADRADVLSFETPPLTEELVAVGPVTAKLWIRVDQPDADIVIRLCDVFEVEGQAAAIGLCDGIQRLSWRGTSGKPTPMVPGEIVEISVPAFPTATRIASGHRLRLDICGSNFPHFDINPATTSRAEAPRCARVTVHTGSDTPSSLDLTVLPAPVVRQAEQRARVPLIEELCA